jgi:glycosyltransferase involved in cell wall biosynthesis
MIRCGLDPSFFEGPVPPPSDAKRLVCIGRLAEQKGQLLLVEAARRLWHKGLRFELVLIGSGPMAGEIEALVRAHGLAECVSLVGNVTSDRLRKELLLARGLVLPSFAEGLPMVIMEAMALGRPVLSTYIAGIPELLDHGKNGWLVPAGSVNALEGAMEGLLSLPFAELARMGKAARASAMALHSADRQALELAEVFAQSSGSDR